ncbi:MAG: S41 family peptidase [Cyclobacteriaceae bacterium]
MKTIKLLSTTIVVLISLFTYGQNELEIMLSAEETKEDFQILKKSILNYHPDIYLYTQKSKLDSVLNQIEENLGEMTIMEFYRKIYPAVSNIRNKHTNLSVPLQIKKYLGKEAKRIPFTLMHRNDSLYVLEDLSKEYIVKEGSVITKINGITSHDLIRQMLNFQSSDGFNRSLPLWNITRNFTTNYAVVYGVPDSFGIEYINQMGLSKKAKIEAIRKSEFLQTKKNTHKNNEYEFKLIDDIGILTIRTFKIEEEKNYYKFLKYVFKKINKANIEKLIIDVRGNLGGYPENSDELLSYLIKRKIYPYSKQFALIDVLPEDEYFLKNDVFGYFHNERFDNINDTLYVKNATKHTVKPKSNNYRGKLIFLIDENCVSTTSSMLGQVKMHIDVEFVGTETGGNPATVVANYTVTQVLPHSKIEFKLPLVKSEKNVNFSNNGRGILPSIKIEPTVDDLLNGNDIILKQAVKLINK